MRNLYLKKVTKIVQPSEKEVLEAVLKYVNANLTKGVTYDDSFMADFILVESYVDGKIGEANIEEELKSNAFKTLLKQAEHTITKVSFQMVKLRNFVQLDNFIRQNLPKVVKLGQAIILTENQFDALTATFTKSKLQNIEIMQDSETVYCRVIRLTRDAVALALSQDAINIEKFDELMAMIDKEEGIIKQE